MRKITFRAWNTEMKNMVSPSLEFGRDLFPCFYRRVVTTKEQDGKTYEVVMEMVSVDHILQDPIFEVMQFTNQVDKYGKEIYEGDIVVPTKFKDKPNTVLFVEHGFYRVKHVNGRTYCNPLGSCEVKVIGNIYENPELLTPKP
tara:strand:+ start:661 stop:1089 length:429 start_codon:yes stop_codon:yes gene_type:complete